MLIQGLVGKHVIGPVEPGEIMLITELFDPNPEPKRELDYDLHDDLIYFMNADPEFYRSNYYPIQHRFQGHCEAGRNVDPMAFKAIIQKAYENYKSKFPLPQLKEQLDEEELTEICEKLHGKEVEYYENQQKRREEQQ